jgi:hypothetical protein
MSTVVSKPVEELNVALVFVLIGKFPDAAVVKAIKHVVSELSSAVATDPAEPVVFWFSVATLAAATVPEDMFEPLSAVSPEPLPVIVPAKVALPVLPICKD